MRDFSEAQPSTLINPIQAFFAGLRVAPLGPRQVVDLGLTSPGDVELVLRPASAPREAREIQWLVQGKSIRSRGRAQQLHVQHLASPGKDHL